jgi:ABC-2 type transport system ATP-binding protein
MVVVSGPNGAGKTTLLLCLSGLLPPSSGTVTVAGYDLYEAEREAKRRLAFVPDVPRFYPGLNVGEHLQFMARAHDVPDDEARAEALLREFGLWRARDLFPHALSRGMRLKLGLLMALIRPFAVLLLDEPTSALDPESTALLQEKLAGLRAVGAAVLVTTHDMGFAADATAAQQWRVEDGHLLRP